VETIYRFSLTTCRGYCSTLPLDFFLFLKTIYLLTCRVIPSVSPTWLLTKCFYYISSKLPKLVLQGRNGWGIGVQNQDIVRTHLEKEREEGARQPCLILGQWDTPRTEPKTSAGFSRLPARVTHGWSVRPPALLTLAEGRSTRLFSASWPTCLLAHDSCGCAAPRQTPGSPPLSLSLSLA